VTQPEPVMVTLRGRILDVRYPNLLGNQQRTQIDQKKP
jgi:hypothetical protein